MPTRRVALGDGYLPTSGPRTARCCSARWSPSTSPRLDEEQRERSHRLVDDARDGLTVPRIALRYRLQTDMHGLDRSRHRIVGADVEDGHLRSVLELDRHGPPAPQVLGAVMAAAALPPSGRRTRCGRSTPRSRRPGVLPEGLEVRRLLAGRARAAAARAGRRRAAGARPRRAADEWRGVPVRAALGDGGARAAGRDGRRARRRAAPVPAAGAARPPRPRRRAATARPSGSPSSPRPASCCSSLDRLRPDAQISGIAFDAPWRATPVHVTVTGAAGQIGYALVHRIASGQLLGPDQPVVLRLLEIEPAMRALEGVVMELEDCAYPLLEGIEATTDLEDAFDGTSWALLVGSIPRKAGMERGDLLNVNGGIFKPQGQAINDARRERRARPRRRQPVQHQLPHRAVARARRPRRPLVRDDPPRREPRQDAAREEGRRARARRHQRRDLGQPLGDAVPRLRERADRRASPRPR